MVRKLGWLGTGVPVKVELTICPVLHYSEDIPVSCAKGILNQEGRASMSDARDYYERYVQETGIAGNFLNGAIVTSVEKVSQSTLVRNNRPPSSPSCGSNFL